MMLVCVLTITAARVNTVSAYRMLKDFVKLEKGDWVIQNAANSGPRFC